MSLVVDPGKSDTSADVVLQSANCCEQFQMGHAFLDCYGFLVVVSRLMVIGLACWPHCICTWFSTLFVLL